MGVSGADMIGGGAGGLLDWRVVWCSCWRLGASLVASNDALLERHMDCPDMMGIGH